MIDLVCLVADKNLEAAVQGILDRPQALSIREIQFETIVHPHRDSGCFYRSADLLNGYRDRAEHALVVFDQAWEGRPAKSGVDLERQLEGSLLLSGLAGWAHALAIDPELEVWVFSDSPHVEKALGWDEEKATLRAALSAAGLWPGGTPKPPDPKAAVEWALRRAKKPRSSSLFRDLAGKVSFNRCEDRAFIRLKGLLVEWFAANKK